MFCLSFLFDILFLGLLLFETSCILGVSLVCIVLLGFLGSIFVVFCLSFLFDILFLGLLFSRLRAFWLFLWFVLCCCFFWDLFL